MTDYSEMSGTERFNLLTDLATEFFETTRWKTAFCRRYDLTRQTITAWSNRGAPVWAVQAMDDACARQRFSKATLQMRAALDAV